MLENEPSRSHQPEQPVVEQIPHSGIHHGEQPLNDFDNTTLRDAVEQGLVTPPPNDPGNLVATGEAESSNPNVPKRSRKGLIIGGTAFLAGAGIVAGAMLGISQGQAGHGESGASKDDKASSASPSPEAVKSPEATGPTTTYKDSHDFDFQLTDTNEQLASTWAALSTAADVGNLTQETYDAANAGPNDKWGGMKVADFADAAADLNVGSLADAQFATGWQNNPNLKLAHDVWRGQNSISVNNLIRGLKPQESQTVESVKVIQQTADEITLEITLVEHYADSDPREAENVAKLDGSKGTSRITWKQQDGRRVISDIQGVSSSWGPNYTGQ